MRLAEFKMRLLVFFAGALRKWAGSIEPNLDEPARRERPGDDSGPVSSDSRREAAAVSGPPEHWTRLVTTAPPDHWLDLIRERAPHLLPASEDGYVSTPAEGVPADGPLEPQLDPETGALLSSDSETDAGSKPKPRSRRQARTANSAARISGAKWLKRLRFQPPKQRPATLEPPKYPVNEAAKSYESGDSSPDSGPTAAGHESPLTLPGEYDQGSEVVADRAPDRSSAAAERATGAGDSSRVGEVGNRRSRLETISAARESERGSAVAAGQESPRLYSELRPSSESSPEQTPREPRSDARQRRVSNIVPGIFVERGETDSATARSRSDAHPSNDHEPGQRSTFSGKLVGDFDGSRGPTLAEAREEARSTSRASRQPTTDRPAVNPNRQPTETGHESLDYQSRQGNTRRVPVETSRALELAMGVSARAATQSQPFAPPAKKAAIETTRSHEQARHRFASVDLATPALVESSESMWPTLPLSRNFETNFQIGDELAALEREAETLRRLDREQRGTSWNA